MKVTDTDKCFWKVKPKYKFHQFYHRIWHRGVVVMTTAQLHSTKPELRFCAGSNLLAACRRFEMVRISDNGPGWK